MKNKSFFLLLAILPVVSFASGDTIITDRPSFSTGTHTVKPKGMIVESGYQYTFNNQGVKQSSYTLPSVVLRTGLSEKSELDVSWGGLNVDKVEGQSRVTSATDLSVGGKYKLYESEQYNLTAFGMISFPTGTSPSTSQSVDPFVCILWDYTLSDKNSLFGIVQTSSSKLDHNRIYDTQFTVGSSISHTQALGSFLEFYTLIPWEATSHDIRVIDAGITYLLTNDTQIDFSIGVGLTKYSSNFIAFGLSSRF